LIGETATVQNSMIYNGCMVEGEVRNSILFPGVHVKQGAVVESSVLFFNNKIEENCHLNKVVADVNCIFGSGVCAGSSPAETTDRVTARDGLIPREPGMAGAVTVIGWDNRIPPGTVIGEGATIDPHLLAEQWKRKVAAGEELR